MSDLYKLMQLVQKDPVAAEVPPLPKHSRFIIPSSSAILLSSKTVHCYNHFSVPESGADVGIGVRLCADGRMGDDEGAGLSLGSLGTRLQS